MCVFSLVLPRTFSHSCTAASIALYAWHAQGSFSYVYPHSHTLNEQHCLHLCFLSTTQDWLFLLLDVQIYNDKNHSEDVRVAFSLSPGAGWLCLAKPLCSLIFAVDVS